MRRQIQSVPYYLPNARLYLDDLETITKILSDEIIASKPDAQPRVFYRIGNVEMDSINDLVDQGGSAKNLTMVVSDGRRWSSELEFRAYTSPVIKLYSMERAKQWEVYAQILDICNRRHMVIKDLVSKIPEWLSYIAWIVALPLLIAAVDAKGLAKTILIVISSILVPLVTVGAVAAVRPSCVYLVRSHEKDKVAIETRRKYGELIVTLILGGVIAELIRYFGGKLLK